MNDALALLKKAAVYIAAVFIIGALLGWMLCSKCNAPAEIKPGKPDTVIVVSPPLPPKHDTIYRDSIRTVEKKPPRDSLSSSSDSAAATSPFSSLNCWQFSSTHKGVKADAEICSKEIPKNKPLDLTAFINISLPPDTSRQITIVDTVIISPSRWKNYTLLSLLVAAIGYAAGKLF